MSSRRSVSSAVFPNCSTELRIEATLFWSRVILLCIQVGDNQLLNVAKDDAHLYSIMREMAIEYSFLLVTL